MHDTVVMPGELVIGLDKAPLTTKLRVGKCSQEHNNGR